MNISLKHSVFLLSILTISTLSICAYAHEVCIAMPGAEQPNAFLNVAADIGVEVNTSTSPDIEKCDALLLCTPDYPEVKPLSDHNANLMKKFLEAGKGVYIEYTPLDGVIGTTPTNALFERLLVSGDYLKGEGLPPNSILEEHVSQYLLPLATTGNIWLNYAKVAGVDHAVFGAPSNMCPALIERVEGSGKILLATTALSNAKRGRYLPSESWQRVLRGVIFGVLPEQSAVAIRESLIELKTWTEPRDWVAENQLVKIYVEATPGCEIVVRGSSGSVPLTKQEDGVFVSQPFTPITGENTWQVSVTKNRVVKESKVTLNVTPRKKQYLSAIKHNLQWFEDAPMLIASDGSKGVREGLHSEINPMGDPKRADGLRLDCVSQSALAFRMYGLLANDKKWLERGNRMLDYTASSFLCDSRDGWYFGHWQSRGEFADDGRTLYVFLDDSGAGNFFSLLGYASYDKIELLHNALRGNEYFVHTASDKTGLFGSSFHREYKGSDRLGVPWPKLRKRDNINNCHKLNLPQAGLLTAYMITGEERYLEVVKKGLRTQMELYPKWRIQTSRTCEHSRMLLPLTLLYKIEPTAQHREWLYTMIDFLEKNQAPCGALIELDGINPKSNQAFGTGETSIFQQNGDKISDQLYNSGYALFHLGMAYHVTGDERIGRIYHKLGDYLTRIQITSSDPLYNGTWMRAFDYGRWEYFGSSADIGWGPYCVETGWQCAPIMLGLMFELGADKPGSGKLLSLPQEPDIALKKLAERAKEEADQVEATLVAVEAQK